jgi:ABC-2 type transport system permease protein
VRTRAFVGGTLALVVILSGYLAFLAFVSGQGDQVTLGVTRSSAALSQPLQTSASALGKQLQIREVEVAAGRQQVPRR